MGRPWSLPPLTGTLVLKLVEDDFVRQLMKPSEPLGFREIFWKDSPQNNFEEVVNLVRKCSDTLERIHIMCSMLAHLSSTAGPVSNQISILRRLN